MYNLTVATAHTFYVGSGQWLVHNASCINLSGLTSEQQAAYANQRALELQAALPAGSEGRVTMGVAVARGPNGNLVTLIGTSEPNGYLRPGVKALIQPNEIVVPAPGHAEESIVKWAQANGYQVIAVGAGRPICPSCAGYITGAGATPASPLRK